MYEISMKFLTLAKLVAFFSDDCDHYKSKAYIKELMTYIDIDSYGKCLNNKDFDSSYTTHADLLRKEIELYKEYKFVIIFEDVVSQDRVSETMMAALQVSRHKT